MPKPTSTWMPMYVADYLADTGHLTLAEHGAYHLLIYAYWRVAAPLPADEERLARLCRASPEQWREVRPAVAAMFQVDAEHWRHKRIDAELSRAANMQTQRVGAGKASAVTRWGQRKDNERYNPVTPPLPRENTPSPSPSPSPSQSHKQQSQSQVESLVGASAPRGVSLEGEAIESWNTLAKEVGLPIVQRQSPARMKALAARMTDCGGADGWSACLAKVRDSPFLTGKANGNGHAGWHCTLDWLLKPANFTKVMEGNYDGREKTDGTWSGAAGHRLDEIADEPDSPDETGSG